MESVQLGGEERSDWPWLADGRRRGVRRAVEWLGCWDRIKDVDPMGKIACILCEPQCKTKMQVSCSKNIQKEFQDGDSRTFNQVQRMHP